MGRVPRLRAWISIAVAVGAALVALGVALLLSNTVSLRSSADATLRSDDYSAAVVNVERLVVDIETGLRGYIITGRPLFHAASGSR
jgi:CHASE3 domain sensor protein